MAIDAIGLLEGGLAKLCHVTVAVTAPTEQRIARLIAREGITREYAQKRIDAQHDNAYFSQLCDHTLENKGEKATFEAQCLAFFHDLAIIKENQ